MNDGLIALYGHHRLKLQRFLRARTGSAADADEIMQELWLKLNAAPAGPIDDGRAYIYRMAQNLVLDRLRAGRRREARERAWCDAAHRHALQQESPAADDAIIARQEIERLRAAIAALPPGAARAFRLHKLEGLSHAETAARLGISRSGVEKHRHRDGAVASDACGWRAGVIGARWRHGLRNSTRCAWAWSGWGT